VAAELDNQGRAAVVDGMQFAPPLLEMVLRGDEDDALGGFIAVGGTQVGKIFEHNAAVAELGLVLPLDHVANVRGGAAGRVDDKDDGLFVQARQQQVPQRLLVKKINIYVSLTFLV